MANAMQTKHPHVMSKRPILYAICNTNQLESSHQPEVGTTIFRSFPISPFASEFGYVQRITLEM